jgi:hypothetical protein
MPLHSVHPAKTFTGTCRNYGHMRIGLLGYLVGAVCLALGLVFLTMSVPAAAGVAIHPARIPLSLVVTELVAGLLFVAAAARFWWGAIKRAAGDHLLDDQRGLLVGLMVVTTFTFVALISWSMMHPSFWAGALDGMMDGARDVSLRRRR